MSKHSTDSDITSSISGSLKTAIDYTVYHQYICHCYIKILVTVRLTNAPGVVVGSTVVVVSAGVVVIGCVVVCSVVVATPVVVSSAVVVTTIF